MCQRYLLVAEQEFERLSQKNPVPLADTEPETKLDILELLPLHLKNAAPPLLAAFSRQYTTDQFSWDQKTGEITIKGEKIANSNIVDIVYALLQPFQKAQLKGLEQLTALLKETNFPALLIRNTKIRQALTHDSVPQEQPANNKPPEEPAEQEKETTKQRVWLPWK